MRTAAKHSSRREYEVVSMTPATGIRSQLYFTRYYLTRELKELVILSENADGESEPIHTRTPEWFVSQYVKFKLEEDEDSRTAKADLRALFARHCEWLIMNQSKIMHTYNRQIHVPSWQNWYRQWRKRSLPGNHIEVNDQVKDIPNDDQMSVDAVSPVLPSPPSPAPIRRGVKRVRKAKVRCVSLIRTYLISIADQNFQTTPHTICDIRGSSIRPSTNTNTTLA